MPYNELRYRLGLGATFDPNRVLAQWWRAKLATMTARGRCWMPLWSDRVKLLTSALPLLQMRKTPVNGTLHADEIPDDSAQYPQ